MMIEWQAIETAPKDGRYIIAARFRKDALCWVKDSRWVTAEEAAERDGCDADQADGYEAGWCDSQYIDEPCYPTHWMPLLPPAVQS